MPWHWPPPSSQGPEATELRDWSPAGIGSLCRLQLLRFAIHHSCLLILRFTLSSWDEHAGKLDLTRDGAPWPRGHLSRGSSVGGLQSRIHPSVLMTCIDFRLTVAYLWPLIYRSQRCRSSVLEPLASPLCALRTVISPRTGGEEVATRKNVPERGRRLSWTVSFLLYFFLSQAFSLFPQLCAKRQNDLAFYTDAFSLL